MRTDRIMLLKVSTQLITEICKRAIKNRLPEDAEVIRSNINCLTNQFEFVVYSKEFPKIKEGALIPELPDVVIHDNSIPHY